MAESESLYRAFRDGRVTEAVGKQVVHALSNVKVKWTAYVRGILQKISTTYILPQTLVVLGNPGTTEEFMKVLAEKEVEELFSRQIPRTTVALDPKEFLSGWRQSPGSRRTDVFLAIQMFAIDKIRYLPYN